MPPCKHPNTPDCAGGECVCYKTQRTPEEENRFSEIVADKVSSCRDQNGDGNFREYHFRTGFGLDGQEFLGDLDFSGATFHGLVSFSYGEFQGSVSFEAAKFLGPTDFGGARFVGRASFGLADFLGPAGFGPAEFYGDGDFRAAIFRKTAFFSDVVFHGAADFSGVCFEGECNFDRGHFSGRTDFNRAVSPNGRPVEIERARIYLGSGASLYRIAKKCYQESGDYTRAGKCHYLEKLHAWCEKSGLSEAYLREWDDYLTGREDERLNPDYKGEACRYICSLWDRALLLKRETLKAKGLFEFLLANRVFGYGERLRRPAITAVIVILLCTGLFVASGIEESGSTETIRNPLQCLYFSVVTFATLGYGDYRPASVVSKAVANVESLIGLVLVAAFAVCLAKRYARG